MKKLLVIAIICLFPVAAVFAAPFGNEDVIEMYKEGVAEEMVIQAITEAKEPAFDTSGKGISALAKAKVSKPVLDAIYARQKTQGGTSSVGTSAPRAYIARDGNCIAEAGDTGESIALRADGKVTLLAYEAFDRSDSVNFASSSFLFGFLAQGRTGTGRPVGASTTSVLRFKDAQARVRLSQPIPEFLDLFFPLGQSPRGTNLVHLLRLTADEQSRTVETTGTVTYSGTSLTFAEGVAIPLVWEKLADRCTMQGQAVSFYRMKPAAPLQKGEYAFRLGNNLYPFGKD